MPTVTPNGMIRNIVSVQPAPAGAYLLLASYPESDAMNAKGEILRTEPGRQGMTISALASGDPLACLWSSPEGSVWAGSGLGHVVTSAPVMFPAPAPDMALIPGAGGEVWQATRLPDLAAERVSPTITALWGRSDRAVIAGTHDGPVYLWDGVAWREEDTGADQAAVAIHGDGRSVFVAGYGGTLLQRTATGEWRRLDVPDDASFTGVRALGDGRIVAVANDGRTYAGAPEAPVEIGRAGERVHGVGLVGGRILIATADRGVVGLELDGAGGGRFVEVKPNIPSIGVDDTGGRLGYFIDSEQHPHPTVVEYDPADAAAPWVRRAF